MALQERIISCEVVLAALGVALRFIAGPAATAVGAVALGLRGDTLCVTILQVSTIKFLYDCMHAWLIE